MSMKEKIFSRKISILGKEISAIFIAFAVMGVLGAAAIASYGTDVQRVSVTQGISVTKAIVTFSNTNTPFTQTYPIEIENGGNLATTANVNGVVGDLQTGLISTEDIKVQYTTDSEGKVAIVNPISIPVGTTTIYATVTFGGTVNSGTYNITTSVTP